MNQSTGKLSVGEKVGYAVGDAAANLIFQTLLVFQMAFYTDTFGLSAAAVGTLLLVVRMWDAITDPIMGVIADRTSTRWGKFRPWILWSAVPFGIMGCLAFTTPDLGYTGKLIYAYVTYGVLMLVYTINNLPYSALSGVMTGDVAERTSLSTYRFVFAMLAAFAIQVGALPLVEFFGKGDDARGYQLTMGLFSAIAVVLFFITFFSTKERIQPPPGQTISLRQDLHDLVRNGPWVALFLLTLFLFITLAMRNGVMLYYFRYYLSSESLARFVEGFPSFLEPFVRLSGGEPVAVAFSTLNAFGLAATIVGIVLSKPLALRFGKRNLFIGGLGITTIFTAVFFFFPPDALAAVYATETLRQFVYGFTVPLLWAMMADVADYAEWSTGRRATGMVFSALVFGLKAGLGFGGALGGYLLSLYGYQANVAQTEQALEGIRLTASLYPAITFGIGVVCLFFYKIDKQMEFRIAEELEARRRSLASAAGSPATAPVNP
jgi:GPH family glycoside/pentoside/hexuronide:cation symporter